MLLTHHRRNDQDRRYKLLRISDIDVINVLIQQATELGDHMVVKAGFDLPEHTEFVHVSYNMQWSSYDIVLYNPAWPIVNGPNLLEEIKTKMEYVQVDQRIETPPVEMLVSRTMAMRNAPAPPNPGTGDYIVIPDPWNEGKTFAVRKDQYLYILSQLGIKTPTGFFCAEEILGNTPNFTLDHIPPFDRGVFGMHPTVKPEGLYVQSWGEPTSEARFDKPLHVGNGESLVFDDMTVRVEDRHGNVKDETTMTYRENGELVFHSTLNVKFTESEFTNPDLGVPHDPEELNPFKKSWREKPSMLGGIVGE